MPPAVEICVLAGGLSKRMGRDKARLRLGGKTLLRRVRDAAEKTSWPVRVIRRDLVQRCGPLGGIHAALKTTAAERVLFLACDMPFVTAEFLEKIIDVPAPKTGAVFTSEGKNGKAGFPFILHRKLLAKVEEQMAKRDFSLQAFASGCKAKRFSPAGARPILHNVNTPADRAIARRILHGS